jgi:DNA adenine methylase
MIGPLAYIGGKRSLAKKIIEFFPNHQTYVELFAGGAQVLFRKEPSPVEVLNFFRVCQQHHGEILRYLRFTVTSRRWHELYKAQNPATLTDIQRAARFFYVLKNSYAGLVRRRDYACHVVETPSFNPEHLPELFDNVHQRLARVQIECLPYEQILARYDRPATLFYCDPPYYGRKLYNHNFEHADFEKLAERLGKLKGKFVLSLNDVPEVRTIFERFHFTEVQLPYTAQKVAGRRFNELLITNFKR